MFFFTLFRVIWLQLNLLLKHRIFMCHSLEVALEISDHLLRLALFFLPPLQFLLLVLGHLLSIDKLGFETQVLWLYMLLLPLWLIQSLSQLLVLLGQFSQFIYQIVVLLFVWVYWLDLAWLVFTQGRLAIHRQCGLGVCRTELALFITSESWLWLHMLWVLGGQQAIRRFLAMGELGCMKLFLGGTLRYTIKCLVLNSFDA